MLIFIPQARRAFKTKLVTHCIFILKKLFHNKILLSLSACWLLVQCILLYKYGIGTRLEAEKYIGEAQHLIQAGHLSEPRYIFYSLTIILIYISLKLTGGYVLAILVQIILNGLSTYWLYRLALKISGNHSHTAYLAAFLFITFFPLQQWTPYLYTESLFLSTTIGLSYYIARTNFLSVKSISIILSLLSLCILSRPFGLLFVIPVFLYFFMAAGRTARWMMAGLLLIGITAMLLLVNYAFSGGGDMSAMRPFVEEHVICFMPTNNNPQPLDLLNSGNGVKDIAYYIVHNPAHFSKLGFRRLLSFFTLSRSYYSTGHNTYLIVVMILLYAGTLPGLQSFLRNCPKPLRWYLLSLIIVYPMATVLQCDDYHSRFAIVIFPYIIIIASMGIGRFFFKTKQ